MAEYRVALVTFIDILGFSDLVEQSRYKRDQNADKVDNILELLKTLKGANQFGRAKVDAEGKQLKIFFADNFSDCIVRSTRIDSAEEVIHAIEAELLLLAGMQTHVTANNRVMLRGGMAVGELYRDEKGEFIFGPVFVRAYKLEKKAVVPRIVIDEEIMALMKVHQGSFLTDYVRQDDDGVCFVDYLHGAFVDLGRFPLTGTVNGDDTIAAHKEAVGAMNKALQTKEISVRLKAVWLAHYHNYVIDRLTSDLPYLEERIGQLRILVKQ
jgi:hypothetical protein